MVISMKFISKALSICLCLLALNNLTGCYGNVKGSSDAVNENAESTEEVPEMSNPKEASEPEQSNVNIYSTSFDETVDWEGKEYVADGCSFTIPSSWDEYPENSTPPVIYFFTMSNQDLTLEPSNIVIENYATKKMENNSNLGDPEVQEAFYYYIEQTMLNSKTGLDDIKFSVWQASDRYIYIIEYDRYNEVGEYAAHQTCYFLVEYDAPIIIYATDLSSEIAPEVQQVAQQIALSFELQ